MTVKWDEIKSIGESTKETYKGALERVGGELPTPAKVQKIVGEMIDEGLSDSYINQTLCAFRFVAKQLGKKDPTSAVVIAEMVKSAHRQNETPVKQKKPLYPHEIQAVKSRLSVKEYTLLYLGLSLGLRRSELVAIRWDDITPRGDGCAELIVRKAKQGSRTVVLPMEAVEQLLAYQAISERTDQRVFPAHGVDQHVSTRYVARTVKKVAEILGYDTDEYSGHSLRSGFVVAALDAGASPYVIMNQTGHKDMKTLFRYAQAAGVRKPPSVFASGMAA